MTSTRTLGRCALPYRHWPRASLGYDVVRATLSRWDSSPLNKVFMGLFTLEQTKLAYRADFALYGAAVATIGTFLSVAVPRTHWINAASWIFLGLFAWTAVEYGLHRYVLHGLRPFSDWHAAHHLRPTALICAPTIFSASLILVLVFLPAWLLSDLPIACALTLGLIVGYLGYAITHHATHHWRPSNLWIVQRKRWHALHHHVARPVCYGVTSAIWDRVFGSMPQVRPIQTLGSIVQEAPKMASVEPGRRPKPASCCAGADPDATGARNLEHALVDGRVSVRSS
jgi:sterol desaturase/sphingolipid hydroxylase (fatty acid hydroxylase superfamily)